MSAPASSSLPSAGSPFMDERARRDLRDRKREAILRTAVTLFNERGYHATSLDDVAARLGISKPVVYHYLGNKEQVLMECMHRGLTQLQHAAEEAKAHPGSALDRLQVMLVHYAEVTMADFGRCVIRTGDEVLSPDNRLRFRAMKREIDTALRALVAAAAADGSAAVDDVRLTSFAIAGAINWPARWHRPDGEMPTREVAERLAAFLVGGLRAR